MQRLNNDTGTLSNISNVLITNFSNIIMNIGIFVVVFTISKVAFIFLIIPLLILFFLEKVRTNIWHENDKEFRKKAEKTSGFASELVRGCKDIKMLNAEENFINEFKTNIDCLNNTNYDMQKINRKYYALEDFVEDLSRLLLTLLLVFLI